MSPKLPQDSIEERACDEGIMIPLDLPDFRLIAQEWQEDGSLRLTVMAVSKTALCPHCQHCCHQIHDCREQYRKPMTIEDKSMSVV